MFEGGAGASFYGVLYLDVYGIVRGAIFVEGVSRISVLAVRFASSVSIYVGSSYVVRGLFYFFQVVNV